MSIARLGGLSLALAATLALMVSVADARVGSGGSRGNRTFNTPPDDQHGAQAGGSPRAVDDPARRQQGRRKAPTRPRLRLLLRASAAASADC